MSCGASGYKQDDSSPLEQKFFKYDYEKPQRSAFKAWKKFMNWLKRQGIITMRDLDYKSLLTQHFVPDMEAIYYKMEDEFQVFKKTGKDCINTRTMWSGFLIIQQRYLSQIPIKTTCSLQKN